MLARLFSKLAPFSPTVVGAFPLGLQVDGSDIEIACSCADLTVFERAISSFGVPRTSISRVLAPDAIVAKLVSDGVSIELFCQTLPVHAQARFRHLIVEGQLLVLGGSELRARVHEFMRRGMKAEPAFAHVLGLQGDPYAALLALETATLARLRSLLDRALRIAGRPTIALYAGDRSALLPLFRLADDSQREIAGYLERGSVLVAAHGGELVGHAQLLEASETAPTTWEIKSLAVVPAERSLGLGRRLVETAIEYARRHGGKRIVLSTATADTNLSRFYQQLGFRMFRVDRDIFTPAAGYAEDLFIEGVRVLDRVWLDRAC
jgi:ribosomal protein S18 acetylase RimI-like enzyme